MKKGTNYLTTDPWKIIEDGFHFDQDQVSESIFSLANEYLGIRGYFEEGYSGNSLLGTYVNGIYEYDRKPKPQYRGITSSTNFMLNCDDWLYTRIWIDGEQLDLAKSKVSNFKRILDMASGELKRTFTWVLQSGIKVDVSFSRILSNSDERKAFQHIEILPYQECSLNFTSGINFNTTHGNYTQSFWNEKESSSQEGQLGIICETATTAQSLAAAFKYNILTDSDVITEYEDDVKYIGIKSYVKLKAGQNVKFDKLIIHEKNLDDQKLSLATVLNELSGIPMLSYELQLGEQKKYWEKQWNKYDIEIEGDNKNQQGIRFCIFQMLQTYRGLSANNNIGAKGLTGEVYNGHCYWETETIVFPFYLFTDIHSAKQLLDYRYRTLPQAKARAKMIDCEGASYPLATLNGEEGNDYWQHANTQLQPSTAVAYAIWHYTKVTGDNTFAMSKGIEMLVEISRFLLSRGDYGQESHKFGFFGVMGPDEFQLMVNHDAYTNLMGKFTFEYTVQLLRQIEQHNLKNYKKLCNELGLSKKEIENWTKAADNMMIYKLESGLIEQQQGYFDLPHVDITKISQDQYPLYDHWSYDRLFRNDMIKQPDVLMYQFLFSTSFTKKEKRVNYDYYNPRTVHESSLSPSIHSIIAEELGYENDALQFFEFATRLDLDNYNNNSAAGLHMTSIAAAWLNIIYGFGGLRSDGDILELSPNLPKLWKSYSFKISYRNSIIEVKRSKNKLNIKLIGNQTVQIKLFKKIISLTNDQSYEFDMEDMI